MSPKFQRKAAESVPMRRVGRPHGAAIAVTWLCSDAAASITPLPHSCCKPVPWPTHPGAGFGSPVAPPAWNTAGLARQDGHQLPGRHGPGQLPALADQHRGFGEKRPRQRVVRRLHPRCLQPVDQWSVGLTLAR